MNVNIPTLRKIVKNFLLSMGHFILITLKGNDLLFFLFFRKNALSYLFNYNFN